MILRNALVMLVILIIITILLLLPWLILTLKIAALPECNRFRAIIKHLAHDKYSAAPARIIKIWGLFTGLASLVPCAWITWSTWATDYSFFIGLFPLMWYYFLVRYLFWEKPDLL